MANAFDGRISFANRLFALRAEMSELDRTQGEKRALLAGLQAELTRSLDFIAQMAETASRMRDASESSRQCLESSKWLLNGVSAPTPLAELLGGGGNDGLTEREARVLMLVATGKTNKEIGYELSISVKTVEFHRASAVKKLRLRSRAEIVKYVLLRGWLGADLPAAWPSRQRSGSAVRSRDTKARATVARA